MKINIIRLFALSAAAFVAACTTSPTASVDDSAVYRIDCGSTSRGLSECYQRAGRTCGSEGFSVVRSDGTVVASSAGGLERQSTIVMSAMDNNVMLITCDAGDN